MPFAIKGAMHMRRAVKVGVGLVVTDRTPEQLAPLLDDALATSGGEPLPLWPGFCASAQRAGYSQDTWHTQQQCGVPPGERHPHSGDRHAARAAGYCAHL